MPLFGKKLTEQDVDLLLMQTASLARAREHDSSQLSSNQKILECLVSACRTLKLKPNRDQRKIIQLGVGALLVENEFIEELLEYRLANPSSPIPANFIAKMRSAVEKSVSQYLKDTGDTNSE